MVSAKKYENDFHFFSIFLEFVMNFAIQLFSAAKILSFVCLSLAFVGKTVYTFIIFGKSSKF